MVTLENDHALCIHTLMVTHLKYPVMNEIEDDNLIHIQPHMLSGTLALAFITLSGRKDESWIFMIWAESETDDATDAPVDCGY